METPETSENVPKPLPSLETAEGRREIIERGRKGDESVRWLVEDLLDQDRRNGGKLLKHFGDSYLHVKLQLAKSAAMDDIVVEEGIKRKIDAIRDELAGPNPTPLERILCERVAVCWFNAHDMDRRYSDLTGVSLAVARQRDARRDRAHRRFLDACKTLASVRRLALPAVQINLARQQVNQLNVTETA